MAVVKSKTEKIKATKLAPEMVGGVISEVEEAEIKNMNWIEKLLINEETNTYRIIFKENADYYPQCILMYMKKNRLRSITGSLYDIEQKLTEAYQNQPYKLL